MGWNKSCGGFSMHASSCAMLQPSSIRYRTPPDFICHRTPPDFTCLFQNRALLPGLVGITRVLRCGCFQHFVKRLCCLILFLCMRVCGCFGGQACTCTYVRTCVCICVFVCMGICMCCRMWPFLSLLTMGWQ